ncbi:MAG: hypothetical protein QM651_12945 [Rhodoblastus sp.]
MSASRAVCVLLCALSGGAAAETLIPRSMAGDRGRYFLIESVRHGAVVQTLHRRVAPDGTIGFTRAETDCRSMRMRELGYGEGGADRIKLAPTKWFALVAGSSKSDLARFVCKP